MESLLGISIDKEWCKLQFREWSGIVGDSQMPVQKENYANFCMRLFSAVRRLLDSGNGIMKPVAGIGVSIDGIVFNNTIVNSPPLPLLVNQPLFHDLSRRLSFPAIVKVSIVSKSTALELGNCSSFRRPACDRLEFNTFASLQDLR